MNRSTAEDAVGSLVSRIRNREVRVAVVGLGYVGLPFAVEALEKGFKVIGIDHDLKKITSIQEGVSYVADVPSEKMAPFVKSAQFEVSMEIASMQQADIVVIAVPTPLTANMTPDLQFIEQVTLGMVDYLRKGQLISLESTTYPGTTEEVMLPILEKSGLRVNNDFYLAHSPERVDPGNKKFNTKNTTKVVAGLGSLSQEVATAFYSQVIDKVVEVSSPRVAELVKVYENTFRAVNIALVNELALLCDRMKLNAWEVLDAAFTKPFGIMPFYPGPGVGGHCIPLDPHYLEWKAKEYNFDTHFIALASEINRNMPEFVRDKAMRVLNRTGRSLSRSRILALGVSYKKDVGDYRESPAVTVMELLQNEGAELSFHDPFVPTMMLGKQKLESVPLDDRVLSGSDMVLILTDHSQIDYERVVQHGNLIFDTRNATRNVKISREKIILL